MKQMLRLSGGGGGGKGGSGSSRPKEEPNSLRSRTSVKALYLLSEGEIEGFVNNDIRRNVFFDNVPLMNADGTENFKDVAIDFRTGTNFQAVIDGFTDASSETQVGVRVTASGGPIVRTLNDPNADAVVIRLAVSSLQVIDEEKGDVKGTAVRFVIKMSVDGGIEYTVVDSEIRGKTTGAYERSYRIPLFKPGTNYRISVARVTPDSSSTRVQDEFLWQSYTAVINVPLTYPNSALLAVKLNGEQFRSIPRIGLRVRGIKCYLPDNYDPINRTYTGTWAGGFDYAWTNNPAWILFNLLIRDRDGCGRFILPTQVDKWSFYEIGQYCDELVPNGLGGAEPRFVCNAYITNDDEAYNVLNALAAVFRGMIYWANGSIYATQDKPWFQASRFYGEENTLQEVDANGIVTKPNFNYEGVSSKTRFTHALVRYRDKNDFHKEKIEAVTLQEGVREYGYRETTIDAFGCDSRGQANRVGLWYLYTNYYETETISFGVGSDGIASSPGDVINVIDPNRAGQRRTGRIAASTTTTVTLDIPLSELTLTGASFLNLINPSNGNPVTFPVTATAAQAVTGRAICTLAGLTFTPIVETPWQLQSQNINPERWRVVAVSEDKGQYGITATPYRADKYGFVEYGFALQDLPVSIIGDITTAPIAPSGLVATEQIYDGRAAGARVRVNLGWESSSSTSIVSYRAEWCDANSADAWKLLSETPENFAVLEDVVAGRYAFRVQAINRLGLRSPWAEIFQEIYGLTNPPADITNFVVTAIGSIVQMQWDQSPDFDVLRGGEIIIKFTPKVTGATWLDGFEVARLQGATNAFSQPLQTGTYMIRAVDSTGNISANAAFASTEALTVGTENIVATLIEHPTFSGVKTNTVVDSNRLQLAPNNIFDSFEGLFESQPGLFDSNASVGLFESRPELFDSQAGLFDGSAPPNVLSGVYDFSSAIDLGSVLSCRASVLMTAQVSSSNQFFDSQNGLFDEQTGLFDATDASIGDAVVQIRTAGANLTYGPWRNFVPGDYAARLFQFRLLLSVTAATYDVIVSELSVQLDVPDRTDDGVGTTGIPVTFTRPFQVLSVVVPQFETLGSGDYWQILDQTVSGFRVVLYNSVGQNITRNFRWIARGY